jgi:hypothetical protein
VAGELGGDGAGLDQGDPNPKRDGLEQMSKRFAGVERLTAEDIAGAILYAIS